MHTVRVVSFESLSGRYFEKVSGRRACYVSIDVQHWINDILYAVQ